MESMESKESKESMEPADSKDFYTRSVALPRELYRMEVLFNLGRAFHQVGDDDGCEVDWAVPHRRDVLLGGAERV